MNKKKTSAARTGRRDAESMAVEQFIRAWGDMGTLWGVNRSTAQVHAFLLATTGPVALDDVAQGVGISRGNASMCLKELRNWGIVTKTSRPGDRKDYFESLSDMPAMFVRIARERKRREFDPTLATVRRLLGELGAGKTPGTTRRGRPVPQSVLAGRLAEMERYLGTVDHVSAAMLAAGHDPDILEALSASARGSGDSQPRMATE